MLSARERLLGDDNAAMAYSVQDSGESRDQTADEISCAKQVISNLRPVGCIPIADTCQSNPNGSNSFRPAVRMGRSNYFFAVGKEDTMFLSCLAKVWAVKVWAVGA